MSVRTRASARCARSANRIHGALQSHTRTRLRICRLFFVLQVAEDMIEELKNEALASASQKVTEAAKEGITLDAWTLINPQLFDDRNVRRRVYDALNVLTAVGVVEKDKVNRTLHWRGLPNKSQSDIHALEVRVRSSAGERALHAVHLTLRAVLAHGGAVTRCVCLFRACVGAARVPPKVGTRPCQTEGSPRLNFATACDAPTVTKK
ncbi:hypothetical protein EON66_04225 [archaeon]|nr:MAG: hypothetical protein EON66_04225 [archaeon]